MGNADTNRPEAACSFLSPSPDRTQVLGGALASCVREALEAGALAVGLVGELGAGKTLFAKGVASGLGIDPGEVSSPTFTLSNEYWLAGGLRLIHSDLYRLESPDELAALGVDEWQEPGTLVLVEWSDRFEEALPPDRLVVSFEREAAGEDNDTMGSSEPARRLVASARGATAQAIVAAWQARASQS